MNGTNVSATEGAAFSGVVATGTYSGSGTLSASIDWGDGTSVSAGTVSLNGSTLSVTGSHTSVEEGKYTIQISVSDGQGLNFSANSTATVSDAALSANTPTVVLSKKRAVTFSTVFFDADPNGITSDYSATISWGDGSSSSATISANSSGFSATGSYSYAKKGTYSVSVTISDQGGSQLTKTASVIVK